MKTISQIEKVNPILVAVVMCLLILLLLQTGMLDDLKWTEHSADPALQARLSGLIFLPVKSLMELEDGGMLKSDGLAVGQVAEGKLHIKLAELPGLLQVR